MFGRSGKQSSPQISVAVTVTSSPAADSYVPAEDRRTHVCPNCDEKLAKIPGAKTKCSHCGRFVYVRTDPRINARICVGEDALEDVDDAIAKANGSWDERLRQKQQHARIEATLTERFGFKPDGSDVTWAMSNEDFLEASRLQDANGMRLSSSHMTEQLVREKKYRDAVAMVARVLVIDWVDWHEVLPAWSAVIETAMKNGVTQEEAKKLFVKGCDAVRAMPKYAVNGHDVWEAIMAAIAKNS
jgi:hypothetical protein